MKVLLKLQLYDLVINYIPGIKIPMVDALSRVSPQEKVEIKELDVTIHESTLHLTTVHVEQIQKATGRDKTLQFFIQ